MSPAAATVEAIAIAAEAATQTTLVDEATARAGRGLEGDRYFDGRGTYSSRPGSGRDLTLVDASVLESVDLDAADARRNVVTRGIDLNALVGKRFFVGEVECLGQRLCEPCAHLEDLTGRSDLLRALVHRGGLRADVVADGVVRVGDSLRVAD